MPSSWFLVSAFRADGGIRTHDQLITNQLLWPTELHRHYSPFWIAKVGIKNLSRKFIGINFLLFQLSSKNPARFVRWGTKSGAKIGKVLNTATSKAKNIASGDKGCRSRVRKYLVRAVNSAFPTLERPTISIRLGQSERRPTGKRIRSMFPSIGIRTATATDSSAVATRQIGLIRYRS